MLFEWFFSQHAYSGDYADIFNFSEVNADLVECFSKHRVSRKNDHNPNSSFTAAGPVQYSTEVRNYFKSSNKTVSGGSWLLKPEVPTSDEIMGKHDAETILSLGPTLRPNKTHGSYENVEEYLGTQYDLLREDAIRPLREAVGKVRAEPYQLEEHYHNSGIGIYEPVSISPLFFIYDAQFC